MSKLFIIRRCGSREIYLVRETKVLSNYYYHLGVIVKFCCKKKLTNKIIKHLRLAGYYYDRTNISNRPYYQYSWQSLTKEEVLDAFCFDDDKFYIKEFNIKYVE